MQAARFTMHTFSIPTGANGASPVPAACSQQSVCLQIYLWGGGARGKIHQHQILTAHLPVHILSIPTYRCKRYLINALSAETVESLLVCFWVGVSAKNKVTPDTSRTLPREDFERTYRYKWCLISTSSVQSAEFLLV